MSFKKSLNIFAALLFAAIGYMLHATAQGCANKKTPTINTTIQRLDNIATQIDSLRDANLALKEDKANLSEWLIFYKNQKPQIVTKDNNIIIHDTIFSIVNLTDTIFKDKIVRLPTFADEKFLKLPHAIRLKNPNIALSGGIDAQHFYIDTITVYNQIALRDDIKRSFSNETHTVTFLNSNPYISSITPVYSYSIPTKRSQFAQKLTWFLIGTGTGYAARAIQKR